MSNGLPFAIVDSGSLFAAVDIDDPDHARSVQALSTPIMQLVIPELVVAETLYLIGDRLGPLAEASYLAGLPGSDIRSPHPHDWERIAELVSTYQDFPLGSVDASVVALAERLDTDLILTLDQRHFRAIRPRHVPAFRLLPD